MACKCNRESESHKNRPRHNIPSGKVYVKGYDVKAHHVEAHYRNKPLPLSHKNRKTRKTHQRKLF